MGHEPLRMRAGLFGPKAPRTLTRAATRFSSETSHPYIDLANLVDPCCGKNVLPLLEKKATHGSTFSQAYRRHPSAYRQHESDSVALSEVIPRERFLPRVTSPQHRAVSEVVKRLSSFLDGATGAGFLSRDDALQKDEFKTVLVVSAAAHAAPPLAATVPVSRAVC